MQFFPICHPLKRVAPVAVLLGVSLMATGIGAAAPHTSVLWPDRSLAAQSRVGQRALREDRARPLPAFLHGGERTPRLLRDGFLTGPVRRARLAKASGAATTTTTAAVDSICRVLLVRVGFSENRAPNLTSMPASGDFMLDPDSTVVIDPPPHDVAYFESHLLALTAFYRQQSGDRLRIESTVFPGAGQPSIKLSDVADHGPGAGGFWTLELLEKYFRDAIALLDAEASGQIDLSSYDSYIIVHPGADLQTDVAGDSPNDIPTFFITLADSIPVMGGAHEIRNGLVMPETTSQDGLLGSIQGALCHEFGHQLGLPDWYDTYFGVPAVGEWSLMDSGSAAFFAFHEEGSNEAQFAFGLLPLGLSAYDRYLLGWEDPVVLRASQDAVTLRPWSSEASADPTSARLDVSPEEYFLIENRRDLLLQRPDLGEVDACPYLNRDAQTGVILWMSKADDAVTPTQRRNSGEYDFFISSPSAPEEALGTCGELGFGVLVWHVDERVLFEGLPTNTVNIDRPYRALRVIEASGDFEIGDLRQISLGFRGDAWNDVFRTSAFVSWTSMTADGVPNNWNSDWARTGWEILDVRDAAPESQEVSIRVLDGVPGWPQLLQLPATGLVRVASQSALVARAGNGATAMPVLMTADSLGVFRSDSTGTVEVVSRLLDPASLAWSRALQSGDAAGTLVACDSAAVHAWTLDGSTPLLPRPGFPVLVPGGAASRLVLLQDATAGQPAGLVETADADWVVFSAAGTILSTLDAPPTGRHADPVVGAFVQVDSMDAALVTGDAVSWHRLSGTMAPTVVPLDLAGGTSADLFTGGGRVDPGSMAPAQAVVLHRDGRLRVVDPVSGILWRYPDFPRGDYLGLALADITGDGVLDILAATPTALHGLNSNGASLLNMPLEVREVFAVRAPLRIVSVPVVADVTGDALPEIVFTTDLGLVYVLDADGEPVDGYPRKMLPDAIPAQVLLADADADVATREVVAVSEVSVGIVAPSGGDVTRPGWTHVAGDAGRTRFARAGSAHADEERLLALENVFQAYPNPAHGDRVRLRFTSRSVGRFDIRIYNLEGEQVFNRNGDTVSGPQEVEWNVAGVASGVYLCRFLSAAAGASSPLIQPITVVR